MDAKPGDSCSNDHFPDRFTCPNCHEDHNVTLYARDRDGPGKLITCSCGARLRLTVELIESAVCTIADPDETNDE